MNTFEFDARRRKAEALYMALAKAGATLEQLRVMGAEQWDLAARVARCNFPSLTTRELVIALAEQRCAAVIKSETMAPYRPTAEEEDAAAGLDEEDDIMAGYWRCQGGAR